MPLYEYRCEPCDRTFETLIRNSGDQAHCPECGSIDVNKLLSVPSAAQTAGGREGAMPLGRGASDPSSFGCGRPQCGSGMCAGLG
jgi:putative FmdB family regulatory protein